MYSMLGFSSSDPSFANIFFNFKYLYQNNTPLATAHQHDPTQATEPFITCKNLTYAMNWVESLSLRQKRPTWKFTCQNNDTFVITELTHYLLMLSLESNMNGSNVGATTPRKKLAFLGTSDSGTRVTFKSPSSKRWSLWIPKGSYTYGRKLKFSSTSMLLAKDLSVDCFPHGHRNTWAL